MTTDQVLLDFIEASATNLAVESAALAAAADVPGLAALLAAVRRSRATLAFAESEIETVLAQAMPSATMAVAGVGVLERRGGKKRTSWDHARLASLLAARVGDRRFDPATGEELARPPAVLAQDVADELLACAGVSYWKVGELRARKVDPTQFCEEAPGRTTVGIRPHA
jgi:hypothetical protein